MSNFFSWSAFNISSLVMVAGKTYHLISPRLTSSQFIPSSWKDRSWYGGNINKDHQRMLVDPMFMIVQNERSFLIAVAPTAVTPTAVILIEFTWIYMNLPESTIIYLNLPDITWNYMNLLEFSRTKMNLHEVTWIYPNILEFTWSYLKLPKVSKVSWIYKN